MPVESAVVVIAVICAFTSLMAALAWGMIYVWLGERNVTVTTDATAGETFDGSYEFDAAA